MPDTYEQFYQQSLNDPERFWAEAAEDVHWFKKWDQVLDESRPPFYRWFTGGLVNSCYSALDWHVENGRSDQTALIYDSPVTESIRSFTYRDLRDEVALFAGVLVGQGVQKGDRVIIYMPMVRGLVRFIPLSSVDSLPMSWRLELMTPGQSSSSQRPAVSKSIG